MTSRLLAVFAVSSVVVSFNIGCASPDQLKKLQFAHRQALAQLEEHESEVARLTAENDALRAQTQSMTRTSEDSISELTLLRSENSRLSTELATLRNQYEELANGNFNLQALPIEVSDALKNFALSNPGMVEYDAARGVVKFASDLTFDLGAVTVKPEAQSALASFAQILNGAATDFDVLLVGHTDDVPIKRAATKKKHPTNWHLSSHRAIAVMAELKGNGVIEQRMGVLGYGQHRPAEANAAGKKGNPRNRRVEVFLVRPHGG